MTGSPTGYGDRAGLRAWLYEVGRTGRATRWGPASARAAMATVDQGGTLHVSVEGGQNTPDQEVPEVPPAEGMASDPVTVSLDQRTGCWMIQQQRAHEHAAGPAVRPVRRAAPPADVDADGRPGRRGVDSRGAARVGPPSKGESLPAADPLRDRDAGRPGGDQADHRAARYLSDAKQEALIAYFGEHLSWPPLPAPHVRQQREVEEIAGAYRLDKEPTPKNWARNRHDVLAGEDGLFTAADWYPRLGGPGRTLANHLAAFHRLVELGTITLPRVFEWADKHDVAPYLLIDRQLVQP